MAGIRLLTVKEMANVLRVKPSWLYARTRKATNAIIPHVRVGKYIRFDADSVMAALKNGDRNILQRPK
ncbi:MAG TPA: helix-turn-helix domain-containing protein [Syntrophales bacterium]|nr:helix-turn-helix domain-containing protein [Syntrophales bacterium]